MLTLLGDLSNLLKQHNQHYHQNEHTLKFNELYKVVKYLTYWRTEKQNSNLSQHCNCTDKIIKLFILLFISNTD